MPNNNSKVFTFKPLCTQFNKQQTFAFFTMYKSGHLKYFIPTHYKVITAKLGTIGDYSTNRQQIY